MLFVSLMLLGNFTLHFLYQLCPSPLHLQLTPPSRLSADGLNLYFIETLKDFKGTLSISSCKHPYCTHSLLMTIGNFYLSTGDHPSALWLLPAPALHPSSFHFLEFQSHWQALPMDTRTFSILIPPYTNYPSGTTPFTPIYHTVSLLIAELLWRVVYTASSPVCTLKKQDSVDTKKMTRESNCLILGSASTIWLWASHCTSLCLRFLICRMA